MFRKIIIIDAIIIILSIAVVSGKLYMNEPKFIITTTGIDRIGLKLTSAYPDKSWQELILQNESDHHIVAAVIRYELVKEDGTTALARDVICEAGVSLESDPEKLKRLLTKLPVIPPRSNWLVGVGIERMRLSSSIPSFEQTRSQVFLQPTLNPPALKSVHISVDGVVLEDGQMIGPQVDNPKQWIVDVVNKLNEEQQ